MSNQQQQPKPEPTPSDKLLNDLLTGRCGVQGALALAHDYGLNVHQVIQVVNQARQAQQ